jgi:UDPglucose--hexose-1-phosphate uridylyltransferase
MSELRWHPLLRQWVAVSAHRQNRPQLPKDWCAFCPGSGRVPEGYSVYLYPNDFAAFQPGGAPYHDPGGLYGTAGARGVCDVILYHPDHNILPSQLPVGQWEEIIGLWTRRTAELAANPDAEYVVVFENTGVAIGVTMHHPHGQIYTLPFVPPLARTELDSAWEHYAREGECVYCRILREERSARMRLVCSNNSFTAFVPFFARFPAEIQICAHRHFGELGEMTSGERRDLAALILKVRGKYDNLFGFPMPLIMMVRQSPAKGEHPYFHFHIDFLPIQRDRDKLKYLAGIEMGTGMFLNDTVAEERAELLRSTEPA